MRIIEPTYTQTPNDLFDHWLPLLSEGELKVLLVIMRKTFGWHKKIDAISISQLSKITGLHEETVVKAAKSLQNKGVVNREVIGTIGKQQTIYSLVTQDASNNYYPSAKPSGPLGTDGPVKTEAQKKASSKENKQTNKENDLDDCLFVFLDGIGLSSQSQKSLSKEFLEFPEALKWGIEQAQKAKIKTSLGGYIRKMARLWVNNFNNHKLAGKMYYVVKDKTGKTPFRSMKIGVRFFDTVTDILFDLPEESFKNILENEMIKRGFNRKDLYESDKIS